MKEFILEQLSSDVGQIMAAAQRERILITRNGEPVALVVGIENKDEEDYALERDTAFWQMIRERRKEKTIPLEEVKRRLGLSKSKDGKIRKKRHTGA